MNQELENNMNRRTFLKAAPGLTVLAAAKSTFAQDSNTAQAPAQTPPGEVIKLNQPDLNKGLSLMHSLKNRKTQRNISDKKLTLQQLSDLLWAADGANRPDGKRTSPAAMAIYSVDIYVVLPEGVYLYDVAKHQLTLVAKGDFRTAAGQQDFVYTAPVNLVYVLNLKNWQNARAQQVSDEKRTLWVHFEVGFLAQNVYLYCASEGLASVVRGIIDQKKFGELVKVKPEQVVLAQTIGYPK